MSKIIDYWSASTDYLCKHINNEIYVKFDGHICYGPHNIEMCIAHARYIIDSTVSGRHHISIGFFDAPTIDLNFEIKIPYRALFACEFIGGN